ncbi:MAG TPA: hypothetical protein VIR16_08615, partial [Candidatus Limnocylindrales bacterium]
LPLEPLLGVSGVGLRAKLQNDYRRPRFIATVPARGYRFIPTFTNAGWDEAPASPDGRPN